MQPSSSTPTSVGLPSSPASPSFRRRRRVIGIISTASACTRRSNVCLSNNEHVRPGFDIQKLVMKYVSRALTVMMICQIILDLNDVEVLAFVLPSSSLSSTNRMMIFHQKRARATRPAGTAWLLSSSSSSSSTNTTLNSGSSMNSAAIFVDQLPTVEEIGELIAQLDSRVSTHAKEGEKTKPHQRGTTKAETQATRVVGKKQNAMKEGRRKYYSPDYPTKTIPATHKESDRPQEQRKQQQKGSSQRQNNNVNIINNNNNKPSLSSQNPREQKWNRQTRSWEAGYYTSRTTQEKIQQTYDAVTKKESLRNSLKPTQRAKRVLDTLLQTPTYLCNPTNIVGALTYSVKAMGHAYIEQPDTSLRRTLYQVFDILYELLVNTKDESRRNSTDKNDDGRRRSGNDRLLQPRQLCNVIWAIAKHVDRDPGLFMPSTLSSTTESSYADIDGTNEIWDLTDIDIDSSEGNDSDHRNFKKRDTKEGRLEELINEIARQLIYLLRDESNALEKSNESVEGVGSNSFRSDQLQRSRSQSDPDTSTKTNLKTGEICMACWAYGKLRPRTIPPGRIERPQMGRVRDVDVSSARASSTTTTTNSQTIIKVKNNWGSRRALLGQPDAINDDDLHSDNNSAHALGHSGDITDELFDAIGAALCGPSLLKQQTEIATDTYQSTSRLEDCRWSELANIGWAFASHGSSRSADSERLLNHLASVAASRLVEDGAVASNNNPTLLVRDVAQILWALGTLQSDNFRIADGLLDVVDALIKNLQLGKTKGNSFRKGRPLQHWCCADLVQVTVALAHARIDETLLLQSIYEEAIHRLMEGSSESSVSSIGNLSDGRRTFHPWEVSIMLWAQARLSLTDTQGEMFNDFATDAPKYFLHALKDHNGSFRDARIGAQEQANIAWSLVVLEKFDSPDATVLLNSIFVNSAMTCKEEGVIQLDHANQLWQAYFILKEDWPQAVAGIPGWFVEYLSDKWTQEKARDKLSSARHKQLSSTLQLMGIDHINESDEDIDVAIILKPNANWVYQTADKEEDDNNESLSSLKSTEKMRLAVEFDGPNHFTRVEHLNKRGNPGPFEPPRALGHTVLKYRLLKKQGWTVVRVPYYEFDRIPFWASMERQRYLQRKLKTSASIEFSQVDVSEYKKLTPNRESRFD